MASLLAKCDGMRCTIPLIYRARISSLPWLHDNGPEPLSRTQKPKYEISGPGLPWTPGSYEKAGRRMNMGFLPSSTAFPSTFPPQMSTIYHPLAERIAPAGEFHTLLPFFIFWAASLPPIQVVAVLFPVRGLLAELESN
jgi:hypothetical protein